MKVAFRADASSSIGAGHLMRCLSLAGELRRRGAQCLFVSAEVPESLRQFILAQQHALILIHQGSNESDDAAAMLRALHGERFDWIVVDHYQLSAHWESTIKSATERLLAIDDLANRTHNADCLLDQNLGREPEDYQTLVPGHCSVLAGSRYAMLRPQFAAARAASLKRRSAARPSRLLVTMGGMDHGNSTRAVLQALDAMALPEGCVVDVILGADAPHCADIADACEYMRTTTALHFGVTDMAAMMANADLAIAAAGSTLWELCCLGVPTVAIVSAENQRASAAAASAAGAALVIDGVADIAARLPLLVGTLIQTDLLRELQGKSSEIIDGLGATRVAEVMMQPHVTVRAMGAPDLENVRQWRNHPDIRRWMHTTHEIDAQEHAAWFARASSDPSQSLLIVQEGTSPLGFVRFVRHRPDAAEWGFYAVPGLPAGTGGKLGRAALAHAFNALKLDRVDAVVRNDNLRSLDFHRRLRFQPSPRGADTALTHLRLHRADWQHGETS